MELFQAEQLKDLWLVAVAMALGAAIGLEREIADKPAGMRTHMLVAGSAALLIGLSDILVRHMTLVVNPDRISSDPLRVLQAIIVGVSFIGAGTIIRRGAGQVVEGLTTAASMLFTTAVGISIALSQFELGIGVTVLALVTLRFMGSLERRLAHRFNKGKNYH